jgi:hypothetical protein
MRFSSSAVRWLLVVGTMLIPARAHAQRPPIYVPFRAYSGNSSTPSGLDLDLGKVAESLQTSATFADFTPRYDIPPVGPSGPVALPESAIQVDGPRFAPQPMWSGGRSRSGLSPSSSANSSCLGPLPGPSQPAVVSRPVVSPRVQNLAPRYQPVNVRPKSSGSAARNTPKRTPPIARTSTATKKVDRPRIPSPARNGGLGASVHVQD